MKTGGFNLLKSLLRGVELSNNYEVNRIEIRCDAHSDKQKVNLVCRNEYGSDWKTGTAFVYLSQLPREIIYTIIANDGETIAINDDGE